MGPRATQLGRATCVTLVCLLVFAASAFACGGAKSASATNACVAGKSRATACATTTTTAAAPARIHSPLLSEAAAVPANTPFAALPTFAKPQPVVAGLMAFIDPETGLLTGPIGSLQVPDDLSRTLAAPADLTPVTLPNGTVMIDLQGTLMDYYVMTIDPLGRRSIRCVQDPRQALAPAAPILLPMAER